MTLLMCMRTRAAHLCRVVRAWRRLCIALAFVILITSNILLSSRNQSDYSRDTSDHKSRHLKIDPSRTADQESLQGHPKLSLSRLLNLGHQSGATEPKVNKELSLGVQEEENSAREVLDGEGGDARKKRVEDDAANEVNSVEPEMHLNLGERKTVGDDDEQQYHQLPLLENSKEGHIQNVHNVHNWRNLTRAELDSLSVLGRRLYLNEDVGEEQDKNFTILVWKNGPNIERRLLKQYGKELLDPFRKCSVRNCILTYEDSVVHTADAVLIHFHKTKGPSTFPNRTNYSQRWIWLTDENPYHTFMVSKDKNMSHYNGYFNWSMSYRMDSDIPVPYGRTIEMTDVEASLYEEVDYFSLKPKTVAVMGSNCGGKNKRWKYVRELQKYMQVDTYGGCGTLKCPGHFTRDCTILKDYKFYLAFENGNCQEYITEKVWWNAIGKGAVPVVMGYKKEYYRKILPPDSFIHIDDFHSPEQLAKFLVFVASDRAKYMGYHAWRSRFRVVNEHGYFASDVFHYCRICEALNYNEQVFKVYNNIDKFWNRDTQCDLPTWDTRMLKA